MLSWARLIITTKTTKTAARTICPPQTFWGKNQKEVQKEMYSSLIGLEILPVSTGWATSPMENRININSEMKGKTHQAGLTTKQRSKFKGLVTQHVLLVHDLFRFAVLPAVREHHARLATNGGKSTHAAAKQLIATARTHDLKVQRLIELTKFLWPETNTQRDRVIGGNNPAMIDKLRGTGRQGTFTVLSKKIC